MTQAAIQDDKTVLQAIRDAVDGTTVEKVFGQPIQQNGLTVLPVAKVSGGGGGGEGQGAARAGPDSHGSGGGLGITAKPLGVFVIKDGTVRWRPAVDINKVILGGQIVAVATLLVVRAIVNARAGR